jgi:cold shock CspA family protein
MLIDGIVSKWDDQRGYGYITPLQGGQDIFVAIQAFPRHGGRPVVGEVVRFEIEVDSRGKKLARNVLRPGKPELPAEVKLLPEPRRGKSSARGTIVTVMVIGLALFAYLTWYA